MHARTHKYIKIKGELVGHRGEDQWEENKGEEWGEYDQNTFYACLKTPP